MAAYRRVYNSRHLQADCQEPGSAPEPLRSVIEYGLPLPFFTLGGLKANLHRHARHDKTVAPACRPPPPRRWPGVAARPPTRSDVVRHAKCKHVVDCCV